MDEEAKFLDRIPLRAKKKGVAAADENRGEYQHVEKKLKKLQLKFTTTTAWRCWPRRCPGLSCSRWWPTLAQVPGAGRGDAAES